VQAQFVLEAGSWVIDADRRELRMRGASVPIGSRAFGIIETLAASAGQLVTKDDLMAQVWPGVLVEENTLQVHISAIRKALGPDRAMLKTAAGRGYRLVGSWVVRDDGAEAPYQGVQQPQGTRGPLTNIPSVVTTLIGRSATVPLLRDLVSAYRVVTLTGPGGIGKTTLAVEVARSLLDEFEDGRWLVELASLSDPELVPSTTAGALALKFGGEAISAEAVARAIGGKKLLLVLDNCEHVVDAAARLAEEIVRQCPQVTVLATSREVLRIDGEQVYRVPALEIPASDREDSRQLAERSAVELFVARIRALDADFAPNELNYSAIATICRHLDGIPLAIEFAAARAAMIGVQQVATGLHDRFRLLTSRRRTALPRHQTLRAGLDWSYELLSESERQLLRHLAIFVGGFTMEAAAAVAGASSTGQVATPIAEDMGNLVAKSLVVFDGSAIPSRWRLLETIRAYAFDKLAEHAEFSGAAQRHAEFFRDLVASVKPSSALGLDNDALAICIREIDNVRIALDWAFSSVGDPTIGISLTAAYLPTWLGSSLLLECRERAERALNCMDADGQADPRLRMQLQLTLGVALVMTRGPADQCKRVLLPALEIAEGLGDLNARLRGLWALWSVHLNLGEFSRAEGIAEQFSHLAARSGTPAVLPLAHRILGSTSHYAGAQDEARRRFEHVLDLHTLRPEGDSTWFLYDQHMLARIQLARTLWLQGLVDQAQSVAEESLSEAQTTDKKFALCLALNVSVFPIKLSIGDHGAAERALAMLTDVARRYNFVHHIRHRQCLEGMLLIERREFALGTAMLDAGLALSERDGWKLHYPMYMGFLAQGIGGSGQLGKALAKVDEALAWAEEGGERWYTPELFRIKGELLIQDAAGQPTSVAEECLSRASAIARDQGALYWELRIALSLARLRISQHRQGEAREIVAPVYGRFSEGFEAADLQAARAMLDMLPP
jgi:predicted ATPase/DNA-binding winged helix-turn-helix (wHTH) protein